LIDHPPGKRGLPHTIDWFVAERAARIRMVRIRSYDLRCPLEGERRLSSVAGAAGQFEQCVGEFPLSRRAWSALN
jgi:hypothetical protein